MNYNRTEPIKAYSNKTNTTIILLSILFLLFSGINFKVFSDDSVIFDEGCTIFPIEETRIKLEKQELNIKYRDQWTISTLFTFSNNTKEEINVKVGFVTPGYSSPDEKEGKPGISNFIVKINGTKANYTIRKIVENDSNSGKLSEFIGDYAYVFNVRFKKGTTQIYHSYNCKGGSASNAQDFFHYKLKTGRLWKDSISDFTLSLDLRENSLVNITSDSIIKHSLKIYGQANLLNNYEHFREDGSFFIKNAKIISKVTNYEPQGDIFITSFRSPLSFIRTSELKTNDSNDNTNMPMCKQSLNENLNGIVFGESPFSYFTDSLLYNLDSTLIPFIENCIYATHGYHFEEPYYLNYFLQFPWYFPTKSLQKRQIILTKHQKHVFTLIKSIRQ
jgi:hypothetical protein